MFSDLAFQLKKHAMAQAFLDQFETAGSGMEWAELVVVNKEWQQLYEKYKEEEWIRGFNKHFVMATIGAQTGVAFMMKGGTSLLGFHSGFVGVFNGGSGGWYDAGGVTKGLATLPRVATTPKGKGKDKAREEEEKEEIEQKASIVVDMGMGTGVVLEKAKGKSTVLPEERLAFKECQGADGMAYGGSVVAKGRQQEKSKEMVESEDEASSRRSNNGSNNGDDSSIHQPRAVTSKEGEEEIEDVEMREKTPLATIAEVEPAVSGGEVEYEVKEGAMEVEKDEESKEEVV
ncbi:hypothetical protein C0989_000332 [Termitomyces sp. Mn162]|nr:hypothetical protein C0989_000332 [Termitomyces sp. Mn162]